MGQAIASIIAFGLALSAAGAAHAQPSADTLEQLGLLGRWSRDCETAATGTNPHVIFERVQGGTGAQYRMDFGTAGSVRRSIDRVRALSANTVGMRVTNLPGAAQPMSADIVIQREPNRYRALSSIGSDGKVHVRDGVVVANGAAIPWSQRCPD